MRSKSVITNLADLPWEIRRIIPIIDEIWGIHGLGDPVCTSGCEGHRGDKSHSDGSLHYRENWALPKRGGAIDLRTMPFTVEMQDRLASDLKVALSQVYALQYDVVNHRGNDGRVRHIHIEFDDHNEPTPL